MPIPSHVQRDVTWLDRLIAMGINKRLQERLEVAAGFQKYPKRALAAVLASRP
jgi:hypothetical protein